jgi:hypothetical protein
MRTIILFAFALFLVFSFTQETSAQIYKYVDKDGVVHFTDTPTDPKYFSQKDTASIFPVAPNVSLDCKGLDIRTVLQAISNSWNVNILVAGDVRGRVTIKRINTPADKLLDEILSMNNLVRFQEEGSIIVARAENAGQIQAALQVEKERSRLVSKIKSLADQNLKRTGYQIYKKEAIIEAMQMMNSVKMTGDSSDADFIGAMKEFVDAIENEDKQPYMLEILADKARAVKGQSAPIRSKPTHIYPSPTPPAPIVNIFR